MDLLDPIQFTAYFWPEVKLYDRQADILYSVRDNKETFVPAGNGLGKDFVAGLCAIWFFCSRRPARVVTTSVKHDQLNDVLWGEIRQFIDTAAYPLPIQYNHLHIRQIRNDGRFVPKSELVGQVINQGEALLGRHLPRDIPRTLTIFDEASGIADNVYESSDTWTHRKLVIGNCYPCSNFFKRGVKGGDAPNLNGKGFRRKVIRIKAEDSPNVQLAHLEKAQGLEPSLQCLIPGLVDYETYAERREVWDAVRQCIGLDADFYEGAESLLFPPDWLNEAETRAAKGTYKKLFRDVWIDELIPAKRYAKGIGVDTAQGGDNTCWCAVDDYGLLALKSMKTPDTSVIPGLTKAFMDEWGCASAENVVFDTGGGGKEHADRMRKQGLKVRTVHFGAAPTFLDPFKLNRSRKEKTDEKERRQAYKNMRAELYGLMRQVLDPVNATGFALPKAILERARRDKGPSLRLQMAPIPLLTDDEGKMWLPPKNKKNREDKRETLTQMLGCSPDEMDSLVLANFARLSRPTGFRVGIVGKDISKSLMT